MHHSALLNVMVGAARKAARALKRDFGELEKLQVSLKGPANFVTAADKRAAELFTNAAEAGNPEAQYALATMFKEGRAVPKDMKMAMRLMGQASVAGNVDAMVEFAIAQFNGSGVAKNEIAAAKLMLIAARRGSAIAQDRMARILMAGRGMPADATEAVKWHIIAKAGGDSDPDLDAFAAQQTQQVRDAAEKAAKIWMSTLPPRP